MPGAAIGATAAGAEIDKQIWIIQKRLVVMQTYVPLPELELVPLFVRVEEPLFAVLVPFV